MKSHQLNRTAAEGGKRIFEPDLFDAEDFLPDRGEAFLGDGAGLHERLGKIGPRAFHRSGESMDDLWIAQLGGDSLREGGVEKGKGGRVGGAGGGGRRFLFGLGRQGREIGGFVGGQGEASDTFEKAAAGFVPFRLEVADRDGLGSEIAGAGTEGDEHGALDSLAHGTTAQHEKLDRESVRFSVVGIKHRTDEAVVAEAVRDMDGETGGPGLDSLHKIGFVEAQGIGVELVRPLRELGETREIIGGRFGDLDVKFEPAEEIGKGRSLLTQFAAGGFLTVKFGTGRVCSRRRGQIERPEMFQEGRNRRG